MSEQRRHRRQEGLLRDDPGALMPVDLCHEHFEAVRWRQSPHHRQPAWFMEQAIRRAEHERSLGDPTEVQKHLRIALGSYVGWLISRTVNVETLNLYLPTAPMTDAQRNRTYMLYHVAQHVASASRVPRTLADYVSQSKEVVIMRERGGDFVSRLGRDPQTRMARSVLRFASHETDQGVTLGVELHETNDGTARHASLIETEYIVHESGINARQLVPPVTGYAITRA